MSKATKFLSQYKELLKNSPGNRYKFYHYIIPKLISKNKSLHIVETGTMFEPLDKNAGAFTYIAGDLLQNVTGGTLTTVDNNVTNLNWSKLYTMPYQNAIEYELSDSIKYLESLSSDEIQKIDLFYFDSYDIDFTNPRPSQEHHLYELRAIYDHISENAIICVDVNFLPNTWVEWRWFDEHGDYTHSDIVEAGNDILGKGTLIHKWLISHQWIRCQIIDVPTEQNVFVYTRS